MASERDLWVLEQVLAQDLVTSAEGARLVASIRDGRFASLSQALQALRPWSPEERAALDELLRALPETSITPGAPTGGVPTPRTAAGATFRQTSCAEGVGPQLAFGRYEILEEIARGGMGIIYKGRDVKLGRVVALKVLVGAATPEMVERFQREARMVAGLHHERILPVHDVGEQDGLCYFTMDFIEGASLAMLIRGKQVSRRQGVAIIRDVSLALHHAHEHGVIHRDVKPGNILVDKAGRAYIADFGVARASATEVRLTASGHPIGTPQYMSPEQGSGEFETLDGRTDVYSLGASLYELLTGRPPYDGESVMDIVFQLMTNDPQPPTAIDPRIPRDLEVITMKALEREVGRRYATARALAEDLTRYLEGEAIEARPSGAIRRAWKRVRKHPVGATVASATLVGAIAWTGFLLWQGARDRQRSVELLEQARGDVAAGRLEDAIKLLGRAVQLDARNRAAQVLEETCRAEIRAREDREMEQARLAEIEQRNERRRQAQPLAEGALKILDVLDTLARHGELAKRRERLTEAEGLLDKALVQDPDYAEASYARGRVRRLLGRNADAIADLEKAISLRDTYSAPYIELITLRANLYKTLRQPSAGIDHPGGPVNWSFRDVSNSPAAQELLSRVKADLARVLAIGVRPEEAHYLNGTLAAMDGRPDEAIRELDEAIGLHPYYAEAFEKRAFAHLMRGETDAALVDVAKALDLSPAFAEASCYRAMIRIALGDVEGAKQDFSRAGAIDPDLAQAHEGLGLVHTTQSEWKAAIAEFDKAIAVAPEANAYFNRGTSYMNMGELEKAKADFDEAIRLDPNALAPFVHRAQVFLSTERLDEAEKDLARASEIAPDHPAVLSTRANLKRQRGDLKGALADCDLAVAKRPDMAVLWFERAAYRGEAGDAKGQLADLDEGLKREPHDARARADRAALREAAGDLVGAEEDVEACLRDTPDGPAADRVRALQASVRYFTEHRELHAAVSRAMQALVEMSRQGAGSYAAGDWKKAAEEYRAGLAAIDRCLDGKDVEARSQVEKAPSIASLLVNAWYNLACCLSRSAESVEGAVREGLLDEALHALDESIRLGFTDFDHVRSDRDLTLLRGRKEFQALVGRQK